LTQNHIPSLQKSEGSDGEKVEAARDKLVIIENKSLTVVNHEEEVVSDDMKSPVSLKHPEVRRMWYEEGFLEQDFSTPESIELTQKVVNKAEYMFPMFDVIHAKCSLSACEIDYIVKPEVNFDSPEWRRATKFI